MAHVQERTERIPRRGRTGRYFRAGRVRRVDGARREIRDCIARGQTNSQIAHALRIAEKTVRNHVTSVFAKLGTQHRAQAIVIARQAGLGRD